MVEEKTKKSVTEIVISQKVFDPQTSFIYQNNPRRLSYQHIIIASSWLKYLPSYDEFSEGGQNILGLYGRLRKG